MNLINGTLLTLFDYLLRYYIAIITLTNVILRKLIVDATVVDELHVVVRHVYCRPTLKY